MRTWIYQDDKQVKKRGTEAASWYVGWIDPEGKRRCESCGAGKEGKSKAKEKAKKIAAELITGTYQRLDKKTWTEFRQEYEKKVMVVKGARNRLEIAAALDSFERVIRPATMRSINSLAIAEFTAKRSQEPGIKANTLISPATVNKDLRHLRAVLRKAKKLGYLKEAPDFEFLKEPKKLAIYVSPEHFAALYQHCEATRFPDDLPYPPATWWRGLLMTAFMTGWRIGALLALRREDVNLETGTALSRAEHNKGKRDQPIALHAAIIEHLRLVPSFHPVFFPWSYGKATLYTEFTRIQEATQLRPALADRHYTFHDLRRAFATMNADRLTADALQVLMQHKDYQTTQKYINMARQLKPAVQNLFVPDLSAKKQA
jgi:integrase